MGLPKQYMRRINPPPCGYRAERNEIMNNGTAIGYAIMAAKSLELNKDIIKQIESEMNYCMDTKTEEQAEEVYRSF